MTFSRKYSGEAQRKIIKLRQEAIERGEGWAYIYKQFPDIPKSSIKDIFYRWKQTQLGDTKNNGAPEPVIEGDSFAETEIDEEEIWKQAKYASQIRKRIIEKKKNHKVLFQSGPVAIVFMADLHLGGTGVDYERVDKDIELILSSPGTYIVSAGDLIDNFIIGNLMRVSLDSKITISEQWVLAKRALRLIAPRLILSVAGNHDLWTYLLTNVDFLEEIHKRINPNILYAKYNHTVALNIGGHELDMKVRHKWRGSSIYNDTHGIERAAKFDKGEHFDIGVGAHTHVSGLYRQFNNGGKTGHAIVCGSYKFEDSHADRHGFRKPNEAAAVSIIILPDGEVLGTNSLSAMAHYMKAVYPQS